MQTSTEVTDGRAVLRPQGRFELNGYRDFRNCCNSALGAAGVKELELDLARVEFFDSTALGVLLLLKEKTESLHKNFVISNCGAEIKRMLNISNLREIFGVAA